MTYGSSDWQAWVLNEKTGIEHIKAACVSSSRWENVFEGAKAYLIDMMQALMLSILRMFVFSNHNENYFFN